jgi:hypothetical protein
MWVSINLMVLYYDNLNVIILIGFLIWFILSIIFYFVFKNILFCFQKYFKNLL